MKSNAPLSLAIAGLGTAGRGLLRPIEARDDVRLVAVADPLAEARTEVAGRFGARAHATLPELIADRDVDAVYVATPTDLHTEHVLALAAGGKHVLVEKPMASGLEQAESMIDAAERAGVILYGGPVAQLRYAVRRHPRIGRQRHARPSAHDA